MGVTTSDMAEILKSRNSKPLRISLSPFSESSPLLGSMSIVTDFQAAASYDS